MAEDESPALDADVCRKLEKLFCAALPAMDAMIEIAGIEAVPLRFIAGGGPDGLLTNTQMQALLVPPYAIIAMRAEEEILGDSDTFAIEGRIILMTDVTKTPPEIHSIYEKHIKAALDQIPQPAVSQNFCVALHGFDQMAHWKEVEDPTRTSRCRVLTLAVGASG